MMKILPISARVVIYTLTNFIPEIVPVFVRKILLLHMILDYYTLIHVFIEIKLEFVISYTFSQYTYYIDGKKDKVYLNMKLPADIYEQPLYKGCSATLI